MQYLIRNNKVEYSGNKKEIIAYIMQAYEDDYFVLYKKIGDSGLRVTFG